VILDTARNCANYIKLVSHGYVIGYKVSFRDQLYVVSGTSGRICPKMWMFHVSRRCVSIEQSSVRSMRASDRVGLRTLQLCSHSSMFLEFTRQETAVSILKVIGFVLLDVEHLL
jgi:hypothetical protein